MQCVIEDMGKTPVKNLFGKCLHINTVHSVLFLEFLIIQVQITIILSCPLIYKIHIWIISTMSNTLCISVSAFLFKHFFFSAFWVYILSVNVFLGKWTHDLQLYRNTLWQLTVKLDTVDNITWLSQFWWRFLTHIKRVC